ncbi:MAG: 16S rRNA (uracil(1498)-N(3))-methyltransferase [Caulobacterales bacterium]
MSATPRLFVDDDLSDGASLDLSDEHARYLNQVLRKKLGDPVRVFNGRDGEFEARVENFSKHGGSLTCEHRTREQTTSPDLHLLFAPLKRQRTDLVVEKATELGASVILPVFTARTNADTVRTDRLRAICIEAAEQTERLEIPQVGEPLTLDKALDNWPQDRRLIFADESGDDGAAPWGGATGRAAPILEALTPFKDKQSRWAILIGPEGGFSPDERSTLRTLPFVTSVSLGPRILRAESAALAAMAVWQSVLGDWRG